MYIVNVAPLHAGLPHDTLSYFSKDKLEVGDLCEISIRKTSYRALVLSVSEARHEKQSIRHADFSFKKINKILYKQFIPKEIWLALDYSSSFNLQPLGKLIYDLIPEKSFNQIKYFHKNNFQKKFELELLQQSYKERIVRYKTLIRESFAKKQSLVIYFPTVTDIEYAYKELSKGIEDYVFCYHSSLTEKQAGVALDEIIKKHHPVLILNTPSLIPFVRNDIGLCIIERESSFYYFSYGENGYDMRPVIKRLCQNLEIPCILGAHTLSLEAQLAYKRKDAFEIVPLQMRNDTPLSIIRMDGENKSISPYLSKESLKIIHTTKLEKKGHIYLYAHRKGMYPTTICSDCSALFTCQKCNRPFVLHKIGGFRTYVCHKCENIIRLDDDTTLTCRNCGGWRLETLGISTGGIEAELERLGIPLFIIDGERTNTKNKAKKVYRDFKESSFGVLIGTEMAHNLIEDVDEIIVLSLDSLFSLPEYKTDEKIFNLVNEMGEKVREGGKVILQTRMHNTPILKYLSSHTFADFYKDQLNERDEFLLPPYYVVIKSTFENLSNILKTRIEQELEPYIVEWFEAGRGVTLLFIHINQTEWENNPNTRERIKLITQLGKPVVNPLYFFI